MIGPVTTPAATAIAAVAVIAVGLVAGRLARRAADEDHRRRDGVAPPPGMIIEVVTAVVLLVVVARFGIGWEVAPYVVVVTALIALSVADLRSHRIPDRILFPSIGISALVMTAAAAALGEPERLGWALSGAAGYGAVLLAVHLASPDGMGRGDVKLALLLGAAIGWLRAPAFDTALLVVWSLLAASALGLGGAVIARVVSRSGSMARIGRVVDDAGRSLRRVRVPFGPALSGATIGIVVLSDTLLG